MQPTGTRDYLKGALWFYPTLAVVLALLVGAGLSAVPVSAMPWLEPALFQGTADDARNLLIGISGTMMTVIALVLGLTLVALQLSSTQYSPRLLRNFLRDRVNQLLLSVFVATFVYATAGLYTVGVRSGHRVFDYPRLAVTFALVLLLASLIVLVYFVHHVSHSIQVDAVMVRVEQSTMHVIEHDLPTRGVIEGAPPEPPVWAVPVPAYRSGYVQTLHSAPLLQATAAHEVVLRLVPMVGEHVVEGAPLAWVWRTSPEQRPPDASALTGVVHDAVRLGYERTAEQDVALGVRQLTDIAVRALSPAVNDPYTAIQALQHSSVLLAALAARPLGCIERFDDDGALRVVLPGRDLAYYLDLAIGQVRRYGAAEPRVVNALLRVLHGTGRFCRGDAGRALVAAQVRLVREAAEHRIGQAADLRPVTEYADRVLREVTG
ncbi:MAG: DUF2254 domain-containing protein [Marmoricola sp.]